MRRESWKSKCSISGLRRNFDGHDLIFREKTVTFPIMFDIFVYWYHWSRTISQHFLDRGAIISNSSLLMNKTKNFQHLYCGRSIPETHGRYNDSGIVLSSFVAGIDIPHQLVMDSYNLTLQYIPPTVNRIYLPPLSHKSNSSFQTSLERKCESNMLNLDVLHYSI